MHRRPAQLTMIGRPNARRLGDVPNSLRPYSANECDNSHRSGSKQRNGAMPRAPSF
jgi:hypothetical protein